MARNDEEYNWLDDPFDEKKAAKDQQQTGMSSRSQIFVGVGCLVVVLVLVVLVFMGLGMLGMMATA